jgi:hypothetical protein
MGAVAGGRHMPTGIGSRRREDTTPARHQRCWEAARLFTHGLLRCSLRHSNEPGGALWQPHFRCKHPDAAAGPGAQRSLGSCWAAPRISCGARRRGSSRCRRAVRGSIMWRYKLHISACSAQSTRRAAGALGSRGSPHGSSDLACIPRAREAPRRSDCSAACSSDRSGSISVLGAAPRRRAPGRRGAPPPAAALQHTPLLPATGIVVVDHGSRAKASNDMLLEFVELFSSMTGYAVVEPAHMELAEPSVADAIGGRPAGRLPGPPHECGAATAARVPANQTGPEADTGAQADVGRASACAPSAWMRAARHPPGSRSHGCSRSCRPLSVTLSSLQPFETASAPPALLSQRAASRAARPA